MPFKVLFNGFPGKSSRGYLGWSSCVLLKNARLGLFDTVGFNERIELVNRLKAEGLKPKDINFIILSHFHFDHVANISLFPTAIVYLHEDEVRHVLEESSVDLAVPTELFYSLHSSGRLVILQGEEGTAEDYTWFHTPGHTPGCISLSIPHNDETFVLAADAVKNLLEAQTGEVWMSTNPDDSKKSIKKILDAADWVVPGHDRLLHITHDGSFISAEVASQTSVSIELATGYPDKAIGTVEENGGRILIEIKEADKNV